MFVSLEGFQIIKTNDIMRSISKEEGKKKSKLSKLSCDQPRRIDWDNEWFYDPFNSDENVEPHPIAEPNEDDGINEEIMETPVGGENLAVNGEAVDTTVATVNTVQQIPAYYADAIQDAPLDNGATYTYTLNTAELNNIAMIDNEAFNDRLNAILSETITQRVRNI